MNANEYKVVCEHAEISVNREYLRSLVCDEYWDNKGEMVEEVNNIKTVKVKW